MKPLQKAVKGGSLDGPAKRFRPQTTSDSTVHGLSANIVSSQVSRIPQLMPCNIKFDTTATASAHEYFNSKLEKAPTEAVATPQGPTNPDKDTEFCETVANEYTFLATCQSSRDTFSHLTNDRFLQIGPLCRGIAVQEQPNAVKVKTSDTAIMHDEWQEPPDTECRSTKPPPPLACTFWLSNKAFDANIRKYLGHYTCELGGKLVFP
jgi:hypothetical protein